MDGIPWFLGRLVLVLLIVRIKRGSQVEIHSGPVELPDQDQNGNLPADSILALLSQAGDYEVDTFHVTRTKFLCLRDTTRRPESNFKCFPQLYLVWLGVF